MSDKQTPKADSVKAALDLGGVIVGSPEHTLAQRLAERRISKDTIQTFDIQPRRDGWQYPTPGGGLRWKNADSHKAPKYAWLDGKSEPATALYYAFDLPQAIDQAGGACWLAGGEPDVWALRSAGVCHALSGYTEAAAPDNLAEYLQGLGVTDLYIAPDLDQAGERWAGKIAAAIEASGIDLICRELPEGLGRGGDIGKAWQQYAKRKPFERELLDLPRWYPNVEAVVKKKNQNIELPSPAMTGGAWELDPLTRQAIYDNLGVRGFRNHWSINHVLCPFHDDNPSNPNASVNENWGVYCHKCGQSFNWKATAQAMGVDFVTTWPTPGYTSTYTQTTGDLIGLSIEAQAALISLGFTALARLLDVLISDDQSGEQVTVLELINKYSPEPLPAYTIRQAIKQGTGQQTPRKVEGQRELMRVLYTSLFFTTPEVYKTLIKSNSRPRISYKIPTRDEINHILGVELKPGRAIEFDKLGNATDYKAEVCKAPVRRKPGEYANKTLAKPLDCHPRTAARYIRRGDDIEITPNFDRVPLTPEVLEALPQDGRELAEWRKERKIKGAIFLEAVTANSKEKRFAPCQESAAYALDFAGEGGKVYKVTQLANTFTPKKARTSQG